MQLIKLTEDQLKNICTSLNMQRAENYVGKFHNCRIEGNYLKGTVKGNHGDYEVTLKIDSDPLGYTCACETSKSMFCKHAAALGLTYIYTPWLFSMDEEIDREKIKTNEELKFYIKTTKLKDLVEELKDCCMGASKLAELAGISIHQLSTIIKDEQKGKYHALTDPLKLTCLYLIDKKLIVND
jgi:hypothetical protein